eukprot:2659327-Pleurochrysis_carterae.AAC.1
MKNQGGGGEPAGKVGAAGSCGRNGCLGGAGGGEGCGGIEGGGREGRSSSTAAADSMMQTRWRG